MNRDILRVWMIVLVMVAVSPLATGFGQTTTAQEGPAQGKPAQEKPAQRSAIKSAAKPTDAPDADYASELPRIAPLSAEQALKSFELQPGFRIELVASEPLVKDPIAFAFDGYGRLFVVEMCDYSEQETEHLGSIARLIDEDGDGRMDKRTTFADKLSWPTAIWPWKDGVLVAEPPQLIWLRDTDGDGISDRREVWFDGFGRSNVQGLVNSLRWTVEGTIHGATSSSGAELTAGDSSAGTPAQVSLRGRDFELDPIHRQLSPASGGGQHGMCFNRWGDKFVTSNSDHLQQIIDLDAWLAGNRSSVPIPSLRRSIAVDGPQAEVFRASPVEPWRIVRTRLRANGIVPGIVEGGGRAAGYFTGATGTWVMDREAGFGDDQTDTALVCDVGSNLVHRKRLLPKGLFWSGERIDRASELVRSTDIWFRPVQLGDGPDGGLYIADMYREVIEHPKSLPPAIKRHLDLTSGNERGRIWRVVPTGPRPRAGSTSSEFPAAMTDEQLAARLHHPVAWQRRMASQLLIERGATAARAALINAVQDGPLPEGRIAALHVLNRLDTLDDEVLKRGLADRHPRVVAHAVRLAGSRQRSLACVRELAAVDTSEPQVQLALAMTASQLPTAEKIPLLRSIMQTVGDPLVRAAIVISAGTDSPQLFASQNGQAVVTLEWLRLVLPAWSQFMREEPSTLNADFRLAIAEVMKRELSGAGPVRKVWIEGLCQVSNRNAADSLLNLLDDTARAELQDFVSSPAQAAIDGVSSTKATVKTNEGLRWVRLLPKSDIEKLASAKIDPATDDALQLILVEAMLWNDPDSTVRIVLPKLNRMTPVLKGQVLSRILGYSQALAPIADALEKGQISKAEIAPDVRQQLYVVPQKGLADRFKKLLTMATADRVAVIDKYRSELAKSSNSSSNLNTENLAQGGQVFQKVCAQCHRLQKIGNDVGPPLKQLADKSPEQLLEIILDPNREVDPKYLGYSVLLDDGRVLSGIIREESAGQIVLAETGGKLHTIARGEIEQLKTTGLSLMPVGLEQQISPREMSELIAFLKQSSAAGP